MKTEKGSIDNDLQNMVRDNLYLRTLPCTTRPPREGEQDGVDYTFLTRDQFEELERKGVLGIGLYLAIFQHRIKKSRLGHQCT